MPKVCKSQLIKVVKTGQVISFPTDTVPALGVLPESASLIFSLKKRSPDKPLILMGASPEDLWQYVKGTTQELDVWQQTAQRYWPGSLTLVLPASPLVPAIINPTNSGTIGIRIPNHKTAQEILAKTGCLATTSSNLSGHPPLETMGEIAATFINVYTLDDSNLTSEEKYASGTPSTIAKWTEKGWIILRQGNVFIKEE
ncbi:MAG: L-threonylcarbamoyladenylate synthase [cyanobacterium endosymbiont of Rhopalodia musculus]|uniref:L-threonylcarbamoyladenylate synthase n=1 Tax=cyanobacterium endosymbiont of Epithemia clementina EcSB TaxID=3034674 RepID=UPI00247FD304|nr:L-threonylcarbamoyladenylate synthase [cyanobacterium endosymbiont of Epithemia clementina EcSB]WGT67681.1 L-threonylcarbamoyladenylate synthase [cyanobacterium endosymbiont of Epithemia clementina EcSB]